METAAPLQATVRNNFGKGPSRRLRQNGKIPVVVYFGGNAPLHAAVDGKELLERLTGEYGLNTRFRLALEDGSEQPVVMLKDYQRDPVRREITHADFIVVNPGRLVTTEVPLILKGKARGVAAGGRLRQVRRVLSIRATPANIPVSLEVDITSLKVNDVRRVKDVIPPENVEVIYDVNYAIAQVTIPRGIDAIDDDEEEEEID